MLLLLQPVAVRTTCRSVHDLADVSDSSAAGCLQGNFELERLKQQLEEVWQASTALQMQHSQLQGILDHRQHTKMELTRR
jgi:regulator of replication initiation timing